jgi:mono/diheme cytochrome c family protein
MVIIVVSVMSWIGDVTAGPAGPFVRRTQGVLTPRGASDGVYTADQANKGRTTYLGECSRCHGESLTGSESGPALLGDTFLNGWNDHTAAELLDRIASTMPQDSPGRLSRQQAADIVAYLLKANEFPAGQRALSSEAGELELITLRKK